LSLLYRMRYVPAKQNRAESGGTLGEFRKILCDEEVGQHAVRELVSGGGLAPPGWVKSECNRRFRLPTTCHTI